MKITQMPFRLLFVGGQDVHGREWTAASSPISRVNDDSSYRQTNYLKSHMWDTTPCNPLIVNRRFGEICCLHLQGQRISKAVNQLHVVSNPATYFMLVPCRLITCEICRLTFNGPRGSLPEDKTHLNHNSEIYKLYC
jgi:hypothetical protein